MTQLHILEACPNLLQTLWRCKCAGMRHPSALPAAPLRLHFFSFAAASLAAGLCSTVHVQDLWFWRGLSWGCPKLLPTVFVCELPFVHLSKRLTHMSHTMRLSRWSSPTISTFLTGEQETQPQGDGSVPRCSRSMDHAWSMLTFLHPSISSPDLPSPGSRSHSLLWGDREPARRWQETLWSAERPSVSLRMRWAPSGCSICRTVSGAKPLSSTWMGQPGQTPEHRGHA